MKVKEHLEELKKEVIRIIIPFICIFIILFYLSDKIIFFILDFYNIPLSSAVSLSPFEGLQTRINITGSLSILFLLPLILNGIINYCKNFINKDLLKKSKKIIITSYILSIIGIIFGIFVFSKIILFDLMENYTITYAQWSIMSIFNFIITSSIIFALGIQIIILIPILVRIGLIEKELLKRIRYIVFLICMIVSAFLTPPDLLSMSIMTIIMYTSYEIGILISKRKEVKK
jgi:sec-independent protein translocase protein TatC